MFKNGGWISWLHPGTMGVNYLTYNKAKKNDQAAINSINQTAQDKINQNKLASSDQTTENNTTTTDTNTTKKLITRKLPLNTSSTGATIGSSTSVGLNLGGY